MAGFLSRTELQSFLRSIQTLYCPADLENFSRYLSQALDGLIPSEADNFQLKPRSTNYVVQGGEMNDHCVFRVRRWQILKPLRNRIRRSGYDDERKPGGGE